MSESEIQAIAEREALTSPTVEMWLSDARRWYRHKKIDEFVAYSLPGLRQWGYPMLCFDLSTVPPADRVSTADCFTGPLFSPTLRGVNSEFARLSRPALNLVIDENEVSIHLPPVMRQDSVGEWWPIRLFLVLDGRVLANPTKLTFDVEIPLSFAAVWEGRERRRKTSPKQR